MHANFTTERAALAKALATLNRLVIERRNHIPVLSHVVLDVVGDTVTLSATDLDLFASFTLPATVTTPGRFAVACSVLCDAVKAGGSVIGFVADADAVALYTGPAKLRLPILPADEMPEGGGRFPADSAPVSFDLDAATFAVDLARVMPFASKEQARYYLNGVALEAAPDGPDDSPALAFITTDGERLARVFRPLPAGADYLPDIIIPSKAAKLLAALNKGRAGVATVATLGQWAYVSGEGYSVCTKLIDGTFPQWRRAIDGALGADGLQRSAFPEMEPNVTSADLAKMRKAGGAFDLDMGESAALLTFRDAPEMLGLIYTAGGGTASKFHTHDGVALIDGDTSTPVRTNAAGAIELSAEAVRLLCGPVEEMERIDIAPLILWRGVPLEAGWALPTPPKGFKGLSATEEETRAYLEACQPVFVGVAQEEPAAVAVEALEPAQAPSATAPDVVALVAALVDRVAVLEASPPVRRTEGQARAIRRAWAMRGKMRARADLDRRALLIANGDNRLLLESLHRAESDLAGAQAEAAALSRKLEAARQARFTGSGARIAPRIATPLAFAGAR